jgi:hypothetical protein
MRYWDLDRKRSFLHAGAVAGGRHFAAAMTVVKPTWEDPVTSGKMVDLGFDLLLW